MDDEKPSLPPAGPYHVEGGTGTRIDLGEDLLQGTSTGISLEEGAVLTSLSGQLGDLQTHQPETAADLLENAKILLNEGLVEDAKKTLRQVLVADPGNVLARRFLNEIHDLELKQIFSGEEVWRPYSKRGIPREPEVDSEEVMRKLDEDLNLGIFSSSTSLVRANELTLFQDPELIKVLLVHVESELADGSLQDWIDLGIAFLEMDFPEIAARLFSKAHRLLPPDLMDGQALSTSCLLALALISAGKPFEALAEIQPLLHEVEIPRENRAELFYLMGRAYESMRKYPLAHQYYIKIKEIDPHYRDIDQRLRKRHEY